MKDNKDLQSELKFPKESFTAKSIYEAVELAFMSKNSSIIEGLVESEVDLRKLDKKILDKFLSQDPLNPVTLCLIKYGAEFTKNSNDIRSEYNLGDSIKELIFDLEAFVEEIAFEEHINLSSKKLVDIKQNFDAYSVIKDSTMSTALIEAIAIRAFDYFSQDDRNEQQKISNNIMSNFEIILNSINQNLLDASNSVAAYTDEQISNNKEKFEVEASLVLTEMRIMAYAADYYLCIENCIKEDQSRSLMGNEDEMQF